MRIISVKNYGELGKAAANVIAAQVTLKPDSVLGLATGTSPISTYEELVKKYEAGELDFSNIKSVNLDEYVGLDAENCQSYRYFMNEHLFNHINIDQKNTNVPCGSNPDAKSECARYDALIKSYGGIDLQLLGLGPNGHIGFNEPAEYFALGTHKVELTEATIQANKRLFEKEEDVPRYAYTMGIRDIMQAKRVLMIVNGAGKAEILKKAFFGNITPEVPASILQMHPDFILIADEEALQEVNEM
jgi:glucosamine-6-phosphate deaminase